MSLIDQLLQEMPVRRLSLESAGLLQPRDPHRIQLARYLFYRLRAFPNLRQRLARALVEESAVPTAAEGHYGEIRGFCRKRVRFSGLVRYSFQKYSLAAINAVGEPAGNEIARAIPHSPPSKFVNHFSTSQDASWASDVLNIEAPPEPKNVNLPSGALGHESDVEVKPLYAR